MFRTETSRLGTPYKTYRHSPCDASPVSVDVFYNEKIEACTVPNVTLCICIGSLCLGLLACCRSWASSVMVAASLQILNGSRTSMIDVAKACAFYRLNSSRHWTYLA